MMIYYAKITSQKDKTFLVEFPELPGCFTEGKSLVDAKTNAKEALDGWLSANFDFNLFPNLPKNHKSKNYYPIKVDLRLEFPLILRHRRKQKGLSQSQIAHKIGVSQQAYAKLEDPKNANPSLTTIQKISKILQMEIDFKVAV